MKLTRYAELRESQNPENITAEEVAKGWHFDGNGALIGPGATITMKHGLHEDDPPEAWLHLHLDGEVVE